MEARKKVAEGPETRGVHVGAGALADSMVPGRMMNAFDPALYDPEVASLLAGPRLMALGPGAPSMALRSRLAAVGDGLLNDNRWRDRDMALACAAGLWLYHDFLDESHEISQRIRTPTGSYWHGIMHRRQPDDANAAYWFQRVGEHPVFEPLAGDARALGLHFRSDDWDPIEFIQLCARFRDSGSEEESLLRRVQLREWQRLFDWSYRQGHALTGDD